MTYGLGATAVERSKAIQIAIPSYRRAMRSFPSRYRVGTLGLGATHSDQIKVGTLAKEDPIVAFSSVMASNLLRQASTRPAGKRLGWLRTELNKVEPGLGNSFVSKTRELRRRGRTSDQGVFDGLRLVLANHIAMNMEQRAPGVGGLGGSQKITSTFCGITGMATAGGSIALGFKNPAGSSAVGSAGSEALAAMGCNEGALREQARIAEANAAAAQANAAAAAAAGSGGGGDKTLLYVGIGGGVLLLGVLGVMALK